MKKLGLIGGTGPESTVVYYREITQGVQKKVGRAVFPPLSIESLSVFAVLDYCERQDEDGLAAYLLGGLHSLAAAGAQFAALTGITPHLVFERLVHRTPIPLVSMVETACAYAQRRGYRKIALLGTVPTMSGGFFQAPFLQEGIAVVTPTGPEKAYIGSKIASELEYGIVNRETRKQMEKIARRLIEEEQAESVVLGCTELPLLFGEVDLPVEKMDVMQIHIQTLIDEIIKG